MAIALRGTPTFSSTGTGGTSVTVNVPTGVVDGDLLLWRVANSSVTNATAPTGWTVVPTVGNGTTTGFSDTIVYRIASSEPASYTWSGITSGRIASAMIAFSGVDTTTPFEGAAAASTGTTAIAFSAITPTTAGAWIIAIGAALLGSGITSTTWSSTNMTMVTTAGVTASSTTATNSTTNLGYFSWTSGAFTPNMSQSATSSRTLGQRFAIRPASTTAFTGSISLSGSGSLTEAGTPAIPGSVSTTGSGTLTAAGTPATTGSVSLSGSGSLTATAPLALSASVALTASGTVAPAGTPAPVTTATLTGSGSLVNAGTPKPVTTATLAGTGALVPSGTPTPATTTTLSGSGTVTASGTPTPATTAALGGVGALVATGTPSPATTLNLSGTGTLVPQGGTVTTSASSALSASGTLTGAGSKATSDSVSLSGTGTWNNPVQVPAISTSAGLTANGTLGLVAEKGIPRQTITVVGTSDTNLNSQTGTNNSSIGIPTPSAAQVGDLLIAVVQGIPNSTNALPSTTQSGAPGWTRVQADTVATSSFYMATYYKFATSNEIGDGILLSLPLGRHSGEMIAVRGVDPSVFDVAAASSANYNNGSSFNTFNTIPVTVGSVVIGIASIRQANTTTPGFTSSNLTVDAQAYTTSSGATLDAQGAIGHSAAWSSGAFTSNFSATTFQDSWFYQIALRAAPAATTASVDLTGSGSLSASVTPALGGTESLTGSGSLTFASTPSLWSKQNFLTQGDRNGTTWHGGGTIITPGLSDPWGGTNAWRTDFTSGQVYGATALKYGLADGLQANTEYLFTVYARPDDPAIPVTFNLAFEDFSGTGSTATDGLGGYPQVTVSGSGWTGLTRRIRTGTNPQAQFLFYSLGGIAAGKKIVTAGAALVEYAPSLLSGTGTLTTTGTPAVSRTVTFTGTGTLASTAVPAVATSIALSTTGSLALSAAVMVERTVSVFGTTASGTGWVNTANATGTDDGAYATWTSSTANDVSAPLVVSGFDFSTVPDDAQIEKVTVRVKGYSSA